MVRLVALVSLAGLCATTAVVVDRSQQVASAATATPVRARVWWQGDRPISRVDPRFLSFAVDTAQVVGGEFWAPPGQGRGLLDTGPVQAYDFSRPRLRQLAAALAPAYLRVGGTDADRTVYRLGERDAERGAAKHARWALTGARWDALSEFARALDLKLVFTLNAGRSARDQNGDWDPESARALIAHAVKRGDPVAVWELGNEPNAFPLLHRTWLSAERYAADLRRASALLAELRAPGKLAGPSSAYWPVLGEGRSFSNEVIERAGHVLGVVSWHYYPQQSHRCPVATRRARPGVLPPPAQLGDVEHWAQGVASVVRAHAPDAQLWLGETGSAQCGGEPGLSNAFADSLWWVDHLGRLARWGHAVVVRQTLSGSDYGLIDDTSLEPNPSYWASWLWRRLMGTQVLAAGTDTNAASLRVYAHCTPDRAPGYTPGGVTLLVVNFDPVGTATLALGAAASRATVYSLQADHLGARRVRVGGSELAIGRDGAFPELPALGQSLAGGGELKVPPLSASFVVLPDAGAAACAPAI